VCVHFGRKFSFTSFCSRDAIKEDNNYVTIGIKLKGSGDGA
jgi:hypothetical protein